MENNTVVQACAAPKALVKRGFWAGTKAVFVEIFGPLLTAAFWKELATAMAMECVKSLAITIGGSLIWYGREKIKSSVPSGFSNVAVSPSPAASAFSNGFTPPPRPTYQGFSVPPPPPAPPGGEVFPGAGWGNGR